MKPLPIPQREFAFVAQTFCLFRDTATDGERLARMREEAEAAKAASDAAQRRLPLKARTPKKGSVKARRHAHHA
ncbi:MAG TPA: hypothetical protein VGF13_07190 [Verrucomicrobiae bacterium]|jgi:hypothetical protein